MQVLPDPLPTHLGRKGREVPVENWHLDFHRYLDVLEQAVAVRRSTNPADQSAAFERLARTFVEEDGLHEELASAGQAFYGRLTTALVADDAELLERVGRGDSAARAEWVWAQRLSTGQSFRKVGDEAARRKLHANDDVEKWATDFAWPKGLDVPAKYPSTAASGLRAVTDCIKGALGVQEGRAVSLEQAVSLLVPDEFRTEELRRRLAPDALTDLQRHALPAMASAIPDGVSMLLGGPTGCGKTFLAQLAAVYVARRRRRKAIIAVPLKALVRGIYEDLNQWVREAGLEDEFRVLPGSRDYPEFDDDLARGRFDIAVVIYEKLNAYLALGLGPLDDCGLLVIDELQQLDDADRGGKIESLLATVRHRHAHIPIIGLSSALHEDTWDQLSTWLGVPASSRVLSTVRPVPLDVAVTDGSETISRRGLAPDADPDTSTRGPDKASQSRLRSQATSMKETPSGRNLKIREDLGRLPVAAALACLKRTEFDEVADDAQILIFTRNRSTAEKIAKDLRLGLNDAEQTRPAFLGRGGLDGARGDNPWISGRYVQAPKNAEDAASAENRYRDVLRSGLGVFRDQLIEAVRTGVGYHTAEVPRLIQQELEREYLARNIRVLVSTKTLAIGVNLPVDIVIVAHLTTHGKAPGSTATDTGLRLVTVGELRNMIGRAGRLGLSERGLALITTEHWPSLEGLLPHERDLIKDPSSIWNQYIKPQDFSTQLRSAFYGRTDTAAWLVLQTLVSDDYLRAHAFEVEELDRYITELMGQTFAAIPQQTSTPVEIVREEITARRLMSPVDEFHWQVSGLGVALAKSGMPLTEATTLTSATEAVERGYGTLEILYRLALGSYVADLPYVKIRRPRDDRHALAELARRVADLARVYCLETFEQRRNADDHLASSFQVSCRSEEQIANRAANHGDPLHKMMSNPEQMAEFEVNALLRAIISFEWSMGISYDSIAERVSAVCMITTTRRDGRKTNYQPALSIASVEALTERLSYVLAGARDLTPLTGTQTERLRVQQLAATLESGLPVWLAPLSRLKMLALDRERLTRIAHRRPDFEMTAEILHWPELELKPGEIEAATAQLATREAVLRGGLHHLPKAVRDAYPHPNSDTDAEAWPFSVYIQQGLQSADREIHRETIIALIQLFVSQAEVETDTTDRITINSPHGSVVIIIRRDELTREALTSIQATVDLCDATIVLVGQGLTSGALAALEAGVDSLPSVMPERSFIQLLYFLRNSTQREQDLIDAMLAVSGYITFDQVATIAQRSGFPAPPPFTLRI